MKRAIADVSMPAITSLSNLSHPKYPKPLFFLSSPTDEKGKTSVLIRAEWNGGFRKSSF